MSQTIGKQEEFGYETLPVRQLPANRNSFNLRRVAVNATSAQNPDLLHVQTVAAMGGFSAMPIQGP